MVCNLSVSGQAANELMNGVKMRFSDMPAIIQSPLNFFLEEEPSKSTCESDS